MVRLELALTTAPTWPDGSAVTSPDLSAPASRRRAIQSERLANSDRGSSSSKLSGGDLLQGPPSEREFDAVPQGHFSFPVLVFKGVIGIIRSGWFSIGSH